MILLQGDFNVTTTQRLSSIGCLAADLGLVDILSWKHGVCDISTYNQGGSRIDFMLGTPALLLAITACRYKPVNKRLSSNHLAMFLDLDTPCLFGQALLNIEHPHVRQLNTKYPDQVSTHIQCKHKYLRANNVFARAKTLLGSSTPSHEAAEAVDWDITLAALSTAPDRKYRASEWTTELKQARLAAGYLERHLKARVQHSPISRSAQQIWAALEEDIDILEDTGQLQAWLRQAQAWVR